MSSDNVTDKQDKRRPQKRRGSYKGWRCKDCGKLSQYYRCPSCKAKWLAKHNIGQYETDSYEDAY